MVLHEKQRQAIKTALTNRVSVVCGGPGTGKSLTISVLVKVYQKAYPCKPVYLCAPTGRAAKRMNELSGHEARTIHRLLGYNPELGFAYNNNEQLPAGLLVVDELSMMDISLARALFDACPDDMKVVLVGDPDQLPSVGPGSVLRDIIDSGSVPVTRLEYVYRQEAGSGISALANAINTGQEIRSIDNFCCVGHEIATPDEAAALVVQHAKWAYEKYGLLGFSVLAPGHKGSAGVKALNDAIRQALNPGAGAGRSFSPGDRCMVTKNNYNHDVFNGDLGIVSVVSPDDGSVEVDFGDDGRVVTFGPAEDQAPLEILQLAFAFTIHKAQGGEHPAVILVLTRQHWIMLRRQLIYTAITRAKKHLIVIHQAGCLKQAVKNNKTAHRHTNLASRLRAANGGVNHD